MPTPATPSLPDAIAASLTITRASRAEGDYIVVFLRDDRAAGTLDARAEVDLDAFAHALVGSLAVCRTSLRRLPGTAAAPAAAPATWTSGFFRCGWAVGSTFLVSLEAGGVAITGLIAADEFARAITGLSERPVQVAVERRAA